MLSLPYLLYLLYLPYRLYRFPCLWLCLVAGPTILQAQGQQAALTLLEQAQKAYAQAPAARFDILYRLESPMQDDDSSFTGYAIFQDKMYKVELGPQLFVSDGTTLWTYVAERQEVMITDAEASFLDLRALLKLYQKGFGALMEKSQDPAYMQVALVPEDKHLPYFKVRLQVKRATKRLSTVLILYKDGSRHHYRITAYKIQKKQKKSAFSFDPSAYPNIEVIDLR